MKKKAPILIAVLILLSLAAYFAFRRSAVAPANGHVRNPDLGTKGGATQVDTETH